MAKLFGVNFILYASVSCIKDYPEAEIKPKACTKVL